jgi:hypothetical protein
MAWLVPKSSAEKQVSSLPMAAKAIVTTTPASRQMTWVPTAPFKRREVQDQRQQLRGHPDHVCAAICAALFQAACLPRHQLSCTLSAPMSELVLQSSVLTQLL